MLIDHVKNSYKETIGSFPLDGGGGGGEGKRQLSFQTTTALVWDTNMATVSLFWDTNMADATSVM